MRQYNAPEFVNAYQKQKNKNLYSYTFGMLFFDFTILKFKQYTL